MHCAQNPWHPPHHLHCCCVCAPPGVTQIDRVVEAVEEALKGHRVVLLGKKALPRLDLPKVRKNR